MKSAGTSTSCGSAGMDSLQFRRPVITGTGVDLSARNIGWAAVVSHSVSECANVNMSRLVNHELGHQRGLAHENSADLDPPPGQNCPNGCNGMFEFSQGLIGQSTRNPGTTRDVNLTVMEQASPMFNNEEELSANGYEDQFSNPSKENGTALTDSVRTLEISGYSVAQYYPNATYTPPDGFNFGCP